MPIANLDPVLFREKIPSIAKHLGSIAADFASCTPSPFDDMLAAQLPGILETVLEKLLDKPLMTETEFKVFAGPEIANAGQAIENDMASIDEPIKGKIITPERLALILNLLKLFFPVLPFKPA